MVSRQIDAMAELQNAFRVLFKNWILALPTAVVSLVVAAFLLFVLAATVASFAGASVLGGAHPGAATALAGAGGFTLLLGGVGIVLLLLLAQAIVMGAAENVWHGQPADLVGGISKAMGKLPSLIVLFLIALVAGVICGVLVLALGLGVVLALLLGFFFMYTVPAIVVGNQSTLDALGTSYRLVRANLGPSLTAFLGIIVVTIIGEIVTRLFHFIPALNVVVAFFIGGLTYAYGALVLVRFYDLLRVSVAPATPVSRMTA